MGMSRINPAGLFSSLFSPSVRSELPDGDGRCEMRDASETGAGSFHLFHISMCISVE